MRPQRAASSLVTLAAAGLPAFLLSGAPAHAAAAPVFTPARPHAVAARPLRYQIRAGDTLGSISRRVYGSDAWWPQLRLQNRPEAADPAALAVGHWLSVGPRWRHRPQVPPRFIVKPAAVAATALAQPQPPATATGVSGFEACVIQAESGGNPRAYNSSSGASGLFGFLLSTWDSLGLGYPGGAYTAPVSVQMQGFSVEFARAGTAPWRPYDGC